LVKKSGFKMRSIQKRFNILDKEHWFSSLFLIAFIVLAWQQLAVYLRFDFHFILLLMVLPFVLRRQDTGQSLRYGFLALLFFFLFLLLKLSTIYFFAFVCSLFFLYESHFGKLSVIPLLLVLVISPIAGFFTKIVGFEIRLYLTKIAASILSVADASYTSVGNVIMIGSQEFHVDPECMGLKLVVLSLFAALLFISWFQYKKKRDYALWVIVLVLLCTLLLVLFSNLFRIVLITLFQAWPETFAHEFIVLVSFVIYTLVPLWFIIKIMPLKKAKELKTENKQLVKPLHYKLILSALFFFMFLFRFTELANRFPEAEENESVYIHLPEMQITCEEQGVRKYENENILMYIKPAAGFYTSDHSPLICWKGSGYKIEQEQIISLSGKSVYYSVLKHGDEKLYTTWWYDCGSDKTYSQLRWRSQNLLHGSQYRLVNVISHDKQILKMETAKLLEGELFDSGG